MSSNTFMKLSNSAKSLTVITLLPVYLTSLQLISKVIASAATPNSPHQSMLLAQNNSVCSFINANNVNVRRGAGSQYPAIAKLNGIAVVTYSWAMLPRSGAN